MKLLDILAESRRFGIQPGLDAVRGTCAALGNPQDRVRAIHVAGTNGKGAVCATLDACIRAAGLRAGRYTSPHLVRLNERFFLDGEPVSDSVLDRAASILASIPRPASPATSAPQSPTLDFSLTYFEILTVVAFLVYAEAKPDFVVLETGLGGRLDATNICSPALTIITRIGLDHCDWLGDTVEKIAAEKAGIIKPGVTVVLGRNVPEVIEVVRSRASEVGAPFVYAPDVADESEIPAGYSLPGAFNRENAVTALAALKVLFPNQTLKPSNPPTLQPSLFPNQTLKPSNPPTLQPSLFPNQTLKPSNPQTLQPSPNLFLGFSRVVWPGRFQRVGGFIVDGAHNPPAARALASALGELGLPEKSLTLVAGFCGDKDVCETLRILSPYVRRAIAVKTNNPRSLSAEELCEKMESVGISADAAPSLSAAIALASPEHATPFPLPSSPAPHSIVCGSLFLAGEALVELGAYPWQADRFDCSESVSAKGK